MRLSGKRQRRERIKATHQLGAKLYKDWCARFGQRLTYAQWQHPQMREVAERDHIAAQKMEARP
jgi:hypothetical protein